MMPPPSLELATNAGDAAPSREVRSQAALEPRTALGHARQPDRALRARRTSRDELCAPASPPEPRKPSSINFAQYANLDVLGDGEAKQKIRKFEDDFQVAQKEMGQAKSTLEGTQRLFAKEFVTQTTWSATKSPTRTGG